MTAPYQVQMRVTCLGCGATANDEDHGGPFLHHVHIEFDEEEFFKNPLDLGWVNFTPASLRAAPWVEDEYGRELPNHPVLAALRGEP